MATSPFNPDFTRSSSQTSTSQHNLVPNFVLPASTSTLHALTPYTNTITAPIATSQAQISNLSRQQTIVAQEPSLHDILSQPVVAFNQRNISGLTNSDIFEQTDFQEQQAEPNRLQTATLITPPASSDREAPLFLPNATSDPTLPDISLEGATSATEATNGKDALMMSLYEACRMDQLETDELERLVAHIIREDGFVELVFIQASMALRCASLTQHSGRENRQIVALESSYAVIQLMFPNDTVVIYNE